MQLHLEFSASYECCIYRHYSQEVKEDLASKYRLYNPKTDHESNYTAPKQTLIGISH
ncbi:hypothetical protein [Nostoc sp.]|uniref:hypothetical protein n=1 Tax=Nostoc sp. TaxID=1180 RepID=UPI002FF52424